MKKRNDAYMKKMLLPLMVILSLQGVAQDFELEIGGAVHFATIVKHSQFPQLSFQNNERYYTKPDKALLLRLSYGQGHFPIRFFMLGHYTFNYSLDRGRFFGSTISNSNHQEISGQFSQYSLHMGPSISLPAWGPINFKVRFGAGVSSIRFPFINFGCSNCAKSQLIWYKPHGGLGFGGMAEISIAYQIVADLRIAMILNYHAGRMYNSSTETWLTGESWGNRIDVPASNIISWKNSLLGWTLVYSFNNINNKNGD
jgi:hypothetical protein